MSQYPRNTSFEEDPYPTTPGGRPLSGGGLDPAFGAPGGTYGQPVPRASVPSVGDMAAEIESYSEGDQSRDNMMPDPNGSFERGGAQRDSLRAMGAMMGSTSNDKDKKKSTKESGGGRRFPKPPSIDMRSSFKKMKGVFKRGGKDKEPLQHAGSNRSIEIHEQNVMPDSMGLDLAPQTSGAMFEETPPGSGYATPMQFDPHPGGYDVNPTDTLTRNSMVESGRLGSMKKSMKGWFYPSVPSAPPARPRTGQGENEVAELKPMPGKYAVRMSTILYFLFGLGIIIGIILTAMSSEGQNYEVMGPIILGLSIFGLIGKLFAQIFWSDDPCPKLMPYINKIENVVGGAKDPYRLKQPIQSTPTTFMPPISPSAVPMSQFTYQYTNTPATAPGYYSTGYDAPVGYQPQVGYQPPAMTSSAPSYPPPEVGYGSDEPKDHEPFMYQAPGINGESLDTKMRTGKSPKPFAKEYDGADDGGYLGPAGRSTPTYLT